HIDSLQSKNNTVLFPKWKSIGDFQYEGVRFSLSPIDSMQRNIEIRYESRKEYEGYIFEALIHMGNNEGQRKRQRKLKKLFAKEINVNTSQQELETYMRSAYEMLENASPAYFTEEEFVEEKSKNN